MNAPARVTLCYENPEAARSFYVDRCGFEPAGSGRAVVWQGMELRLEGREEVAATSPLGRRLEPPGRRGAASGRGAGVRLELPVQPGESLEELFVRMERAGVDIVEPPGPWRSGERSFTISDPGQYLVAFWQAEPRPPAGS